MFSKEPTRPSHWYEHITSVTNSARELLKHRFIRSAGQTEGLQELIERRSEWEARRGDRLSKPEMYPNETVMSMANSEDEDPWIFATVRPSSSNGASTAVPEPAKEMGTVKRIASPPSVSFRGDFANLGTSPY